MSNILLLPSFNNFEHQSVPLILYFRVNSQLVGARDTNSRYAGLNLQCAAFMILISPYVSVEQAWE